MEHKITFDEIAEECLDIVLKNYRESEKRREKATKRNSKYFSKGKSPALDTLIEKKTALGEVKRKTAKDSLPELLRQYLKTRSDEGIALGESKYGFEDYDFTY